MKKNTSKTSKTINKIEEKDQVIEDVEIIEDSPIDTPTPWEPQPKTSPSSPKQNSYLVALGILLIALVSLIYYFKSSFIAAIVNGQPIWRTTLNKQLTKQFGEQLLESLITQTLIEQQAKTKGIIISGEKIASETAKIEEQVIAQGQTLDQILLLQGTVHDHHAGTSADQLPGLHTFYGQQRDQELCCNQNNDGDNSFPDITVAFRKRECGQLGDHQCNRKFKGLQLPNLSFSHQAHGYNDNQV